MRMEQYFLMIDYSIWEVILNGDSPSLTRIVDGVVQIVAPTTAEQRLAKKNELKARGTSLMVLPDKHQLKFNIHKDAKSLMEAIKKRFGDSTNESVNAAPSISAAGSKATVSTLPNVNSLIDVVIYSFFAMVMLTMRARRFLKRTGRNLGANGIDTIGFDMSKVECYNFHRRAYFARECRSPRDNMNKNNPRRTALVEDDEEPNNYALMAYASSDSSSSPGSDNEVASCSKAYSKAYATLQTHYDNLTFEFRKSQFDVLSYKMGLESIEARLVVYQQNETVFEQDIKLLKLDVMLRDNALAELRMKFEKAEKERDELKLTLDKFKTSSKNISKLLESQVRDKTGLGFDNQLFNSQVFDYDEFHSHESDTSVPKHPKDDRYKTCERYHVVPPPYTRTFLPPKPDLVLSDDPITSELVANVFNIESSTNKPRKDMSKSLRPDAPIVKYWISDSEETKIEPVPNAVSQSTLKSPRPIKYVVHKAHSPTRRPINHRPATNNSNFNKKVTVVKVNKIQVSNGLGLQKTLSFLFDVHGNPQQALKDKCVIDSSFSRHMTGNISFLLDFDEINRGYVAFGGNPKCDKISSKGKIKTCKLDFDDVYFLKELKFNLFSVSQMCDKKNSVLFTDTDCVVLYSDFKLPDENHVLLRVPIVNNMYNFDLKNVVSSGDLTCLFAKATLNESNLWH
nr:ribonuclease H-like domain-containing protein [Tanacetum cinerariifolium]